MCKYNNHYFWEGALISKKDLWRSYFAEPVSAQDALFINTAIIDYNRHTLDNNWACYPNVKALLGFIQYVYLPLAFFFTLNKENEALYIPMCSSNELIEEHIRPSAAADKVKMEAFVEELQTYWDLEDCICLEKIRDFCRRFNGTWNSDHYILHIGVFANTYEIAQYLIDTREFVEVLEEDIGLTSRQLFSMCQNFYHDKFMQKNFVNILNHKIGCIV